MATFKEFPLAPGAADHRHAEDRALAAARGKKRRHEDDRNEFASGRPAEARGRSHGRRPGRRAAPSCNGERGSANGAPRRSFAGVPSLPRKPRGAGQAGAARRQAHPVEARLGQGRHEVHARRRAASSRRIPRSTSSGATARSSSYVLNPTPDNVEYYGRKIDKVNVVLAKAKTDAAGTLTVGLTAPGTTARSRHLRRRRRRPAREGRLQINRQSLGQPMLGAGRHADHDHGDRARLAPVHRARSPFSTTTTTRGSSLRRTRAGSRRRRFGRPGPSGRMRSRSLLRATRCRTSTSSSRRSRSSGSSAPPSRSPGTAGRRATRVEWPEKTTPTVDARTTLTTLAAGGATASLSSQGGPILSKVDVQAAGLTPGASV